MAVTSVVFAILLLGAGCVNREANTTPPQDDIIYGTSWTQEEQQQWEKECTALGGEFDECGSSCKDGGICVQVCAARCEFKE